MYALIRPHGTFIPWAKNFRTVYGSCRTGTREIVGHGINGCANYKDDVHFPFPAVRFKEMTRDICHTVAEDTRMSDAKDIEREHGALAVRSNMLARRFAYCNRENADGDAALLQCVTDVFGGSYRRFLWHNEEKSGICDEFSTRKLQQYSENTGRKVGNPFYEALGRLTCQLQISLEVQALKEKEKGDWRMLCCEEKKALYRASFCQTFAEFQAPTGLWKLIFGYVFFITSFAFWTAMFCHYYVFEPLPASFSKESQKAQLRRMLELRVNPIDGLSSHWDYDNDKWID